MRRLFLKLSFLSLFSTVVNAQWVQTSLDSVGVDCLAVDGTLFLAGTRDSGVFLSTDGGTSWTAVNSGLTSRYILAVAIKDTNLFAGIFIGGVFRSTNLGATWTASGLVNYTINAFAVSDSNLFIGTAGGGIFRSGNNGKTWTDVSPGLPPWSSVQCFAVSWTNLFAGTWLGAFFYAGEVLLSTNNGASWESADAGLMGEEVASLAMDGTNIFAGTRGNPGSGVFLSTNNGASWTAVDSGMTDGSVLALAMSGRTIFAGYTKVFFSTNSGKTWTDFTSNLPFGHVNSLAVSGPYLFAGTGFGVWRRPLSDMVTAVKENKDNVLPTTYSLNQNYPNPFNPSTSITYSVPKEIHVSLKVCDILGREIATLVNETKRPGRYTVHWEAKDVPSGMYFYRLGAGSFVEMKKLIVMK